jgi:hypothetical protein
LPVALFVIRRSIRERWAPLLELVVAVVFAGAVLVTGSRLAMVSLAVGLGAWLAADERSVLSFRSRLWGLAGAAVAAVLLVAVAAASSDAVRERMLHVDSLRGRVGLAGASATLVIRDPVAGHGLDHFRVALPEGLRSFSEHVGSSAQPYMPRTLVDHADSDLLEIAVEGGIPAAMLMLTIWILGFRRAFFAGPAEDRSSRLALGCSLLALAASALGSSPLHTPATALLFWVFVGLLAVEVGETPSHTAGRSHGHRGFDRGVALIGALAAAAATMYYAAVLVTANRGARAARAEVASDHLDRAEEIYRQIIRDAPWDGESRLYLAGLLIARADYEEGLAMVRTSQRWSASQRAWLLEARALAATARLQEAIEVLETAVAALPEGRAMLVELGELYLAAGNGDAAADAFRRALASRQRAPGAEALDRRARDGLARVSR